MSSSSNKRDFFFIPNWIKKVLERNQLPLTTVLDLNSLSEVVSSEDLALIAYLNLSCEEYLGIPQFDYWAMYRHWTKVQTDMDKYNNQVIPLLPLVKETIKTRLFSDEVFDSQKAGDTPKAFSIKDLDKEVVFVIIHPGYFGTQRAAESKESLMTTLLKLCYAHEGFDSMAERQLFQRYMSYLNAVK